MRYYTFRGDGLALGSVIVVRAENLSDARAAAGALMMEWNLDPESLRPISDAAETGGTQIVSAWNGDY